MLLPGPCRPPNREASFTFWAALSQASPALRVKGVTNSLPVRNLTEICIKKKIVFKFEPLTISDSGLNSLVEGLGCVWRVFWCMASETIEPDQWPSPHITNQWYPSKHARSCPSNTKHSFWCQVLNLVIPFLFLFVYLFHQLSRECPGSLACWHASLPTMRRQDVNPFIYYLQLLNEFKWREDGS